MAQWFHKEAGPCEGSFSLIEADPCWAYSNQGGRGAADKHYQTMSLAELIALPVEKLAAPDAVLFLWATWPTLPDAFALMKAWSFEYKNCGLLWAKTNKVASTPFVGLGHWTRGNSEPCLFGVRGKPKRVDAAVQQLLVDDLLVAPVGEHSAKPIEAKERMLRLVGEDVPAIELFARSKHPAFESWGLEVESTVELRT